MSGILIINNGVSDMTPAQAIEYINNKANYESSKLSDLIFAFGSHDKEYWETKKPDYRSCRKIYFKGAQSVGYPIAYKVIANVQDNKYDGTIQLYDDINDNIIFEFNIDDESSTIYTITEFNNFPEEETILDLRAKSSRDRKYIRLNSFCLIF